MDEEEDQKGIDKKSFKRKIIMGMILVCVVSMLIGAIFLVFQ
jgi:hypothetical protein